MKLKKLLDLITEAQKKHGDVILDLPVRLILECDGKQFEDSLKNIACVTTSKMSGPPYPSRIMLIGESFD
jgi:hypothetical protein